jgi:hypothetical protein
MVIALAARRIDPEGAGTASFPLAHAPRVRERLAAVITARSASALVSSAACGADLVALDVARDLGLRRRIVLPFGRAEFRRRSVVDRPGEWGPLFDALCDEAERAGDLAIALQTAPGDAAYLAANDGSCRRLRLAGGASGVLAAVVWDGRRKGPFDATAALRDSAVDRGIAVVDVPTS